MSESTVTRLESLSNEILLDIFEYLDWRTLHRTFSRLNSRLESLINNGRLHLFLQDEFEENDVSTDESLIFNPERVRILTVVNPERLDHLNLSKMTNLITVTLSQVNFDLIEFFFDNLTEIHSIKNLCIDEFSLRYQDFDHVESCYKLLDRYGHRLSSLTSLSFRSSNFNFLDMAKLNHEFTSLKYFKVSQPNITRELLQFIWKKTPKLEFLSVDSRYRLDFAEKPMPHVMESVKQLDLIIKYSDLAILHFLNLFPNLKQLRCNYRIRSIYEDVLVIENWKKILEMSLKNLEGFTLNFTESHICCRNYSTLETDEFWLKKNLRLTFISDIATPHQLSVKSISFGKEWHTPTWMDYIKHLSNLTFR